MTDDASETPSKPDLGAAQSIRRKDLIDLGNDFTQALKPIATLVEHMKEGNQYTQELRVAVRRQTYAIWGVIVLVVAVLVFLYTVATQVKQNSQDTEDLQKDLTGALEELRDITAVAQETNESVVAAEKRAFMQPTVQLVPELDPEKAKKAPMKLLIETPRELPSNKPASASRRPRGKSASKSATVEIPISAEAF